MTEKMKELKAWLKENCLVIRSSRRDFRECQRKGGASLNPNGWVFSSLKYEYRHRHIVYSQLRGRTREEIERPKENNLPNETYILSLMEQYGEKHEQTICAS